jgi:hypothetical protein
MVGSVPLQDVVDALGERNAIWVTGVPEPGDHEVECEWRDDKLRYRFWAPGQPHDADALWYRNFENWRRDAQGTRFPPPPPIPPDADHVLYGALLSTSGQPVRFVVPGDASPAMEHATWVAFLCGGAKHAAFLWEKGSYGGTLVLSKSGERWANPTETDGWME